MDYQRITDVPAVSDVAGSDSVYIRQGDTFRRISITDFLQALGITDGVSPTVTVTDITGGHRVTITDATGTKTFNVMDGATGADGSDGNDGADGGYYTPAFAVDFYSANTASAPFLSDGENTFGIIRAGQTQQFVPGNLVAGTHIFVLRGNYAFLINPNLGDASAIAAAIDRGLE